MSADTNEQPRPKKKRKKPARIDVERAARMLCDLHDLGPEQTAKLHRVTTRTLRRYKALVDEDAALKAKYLELATLRDGAWATERAKALRAAVARATELVAKEEDLDKITRFIEKVGSVDVEGCDQMKVAWMVPRSQFFGIGTANWAYSAVIESKSRE
jgi:site-specific recombinase XerC